MGAPNFLIMLLDIQNMNIEPIPLIEVAAPDVYTHTHLVLIY